MRKALVCAGLLGAAMAHADDSAGPYIGAGVGVLSLEMKDEGLTFEGEDTAFRLFGGYRFNPYIAAEASFLDGGAPSDTILGQEIAIDTTGLSLYAIGSFPLRHGWSFFGKVGMTKWETTITNKTYGISVDDDGTDISIGGGAALDFAFPLRLRAELETINIDDVDVTLFTVSAAYRF